MTEAKMPQLSKELARRIRIVRRDIGSLLFHFTRLPAMKSVQIEQPHSTTIMSASAGAVLRKILWDGYLLGSSTWTHGENCICFTEAPIHEFNSIFSLVAIASSESERPRYEPYGVAVTKRWLFAQGGRPVIYDHPDALATIPTEQRYRFVAYDPTREIDFTWEREWRYRGDRLFINPKETLVVVPTADEAFEIAYELADMEADYDRDGNLEGAYHVPRWLTVSLDIFGFEP
ncbi:MAG: hypothetical protein QG657_2254 [Acidobacteriota bacterium]|nr:hypothetical protein [Acidobacteriota bacterium]